MSTSAILSVLLTRKAEKVFCTQKQIFFSERYEAYADMVAEQTKLEEKWYDAYDKCMDGKDDGSGVQFKGRTFNPNSECDAIEYADLKVDNYDLEKLEEYTELSTEYEVAKTVWETKLEEINTVIESTKAELQREAQETHLVNAG